MVSTGVVRASRQSELEAIEAQSDAHPELLTRLINVLAQEGLIVLLRPGFVEIALYRCASQMTESDPLVYRRSGSV